ncbi:EspA/EspE family type VII secretion system effector [Mycobacterium genavense]|uniref:EspA/EspE family type VII secretion system effector n=1 Tax=Mycobacterium genavense TaxID=36812 RepID=UPI0004714583|nr:EspA/EspE family type VII secretion system effector [Mycobacterium genavense]
MLELTTGFGPPYEGDDFTAGSEQLTEICAQLKTALPDDTWQGDASEHYAEQVTALSDLAKKIADLDHQLAEITKNQAEWVTHAWVSAP